MSAADVLMKHGRHRLRILAVDCQPWTEDQPLDVRGEWRALTDAVHAGELPVTLARASPPTLGQLRQAVQIGAQAGCAPHVLHFAGHGEVDRLRLEDELGRAALTPWPQIQQALKPWGDGPLQRLQVVVLNACHSASTHTTGLAERLVQQGVSRVAIGYDVRVADPAAVRFTRVFYADLAQGRMVNIAFATARDALRVDFPSAWRAVALEGDGAFTIDVRSTLRAPRIFDGRPQPYQMRQATRFFGRSVEAVQLSAWLADTSLRGIAVTGVGGIGKSALCRAVVHRHAWRFEGGIVEASARVDGPFGLPSATDLILQTAAALGVRAETPEATIDMLVAHAAAEPILLYFDNLETLAPVELGQLLSLMERLPLNGSKALLSMRPLTDQLAESKDMRTLSLTRGLTEQPAAAYAVALARHQIPMVRHLADATRINGQWQGLSLQLAKATGGHPKMIEVAVGVLRRHGEPGLKPALPAALDANIAHTLTAEALRVTRDRLFARSFELLDAAGRAVLQVLTACPTDTVTDVEGRAGLSAIDTTLDWNAGVASCVAAGLLARDEDVLSYHSSVVQLARIALPMSDIALARVFIGLLSEALDFGTRNSDSPSKIKPRHTHLFSLFETAWKNTEGNPDAGPLRASIQAVVDRLGYYLLRSGAWPLMQHWRARLGEGDQRVEGHRAYKNAILAFYRGDYPQARHLLGSAISIWKALDNVQGRVAAQHQLARVEFAQSNFDEARRLFVGCIADSVASDDLTARAASQHQLARVEYAQGNLAESRRLLLSAMDLQRRLKDRGGLAASAHQLARLEYAQGNLTEARRQLVDAGNAYDDDDQQARAAAAYLLSRIEYAEGNLVETRRLLTECIAINEAAGGRQGLATCLHQLAILDFTQGHFAEARRGLDRSISIKEALRDHRGRAASLHQLAIVEYAEGNLTESRRLSTQSVATFVTLGDRKGRSAALHQLAIVAQAQGDMREARDRLAESIALTDPLDDPRSRAVSDFQLASIEQDLGNLDEAGRLLAEVIVRQVALGHAQGHAASLHQLAIVEYMQGNLMAARRCATDAITIKEELGDRAGRAASMHQLALIEDALGNREAAHQLLSDVQAMHQLLGNRRGYAASLALSGQLRFAAGDQEAGLAEVEEAARLLGALGDGRAPSLDALAAQMRSATT